MVILKWLNILNVCLGVDKRDGKQGGPGKGEILFADEMPITRIQQLVNVTRPTFYKGIDKALAASLEGGLKDLYHKPYPLEILSFSSHSAIRS